MSVVSFLVILAAGAALALAVGGVSPAKPALARLHAERRQTTWLNSMFRS
jgi:hypothetical protein